MSILVARAGCISYVRRMTSREPLSKTRLDQALDAAGIGAYEWDVASDTFTVSPRLAAISGLPAGSAPGRGGQVIDAFIHPDDLPALLARRGGNYARGGSFENEYRLVRPDDG